MNQDYRSPAFCDPTPLLQAAIAQIEVFTQEGSASLDVKEDGTLVAIPTTRLDKIIMRARHFIEPIFSNQSRQEQEKKLSQIKEKILHARDLIQSHSLLIEKLKEGNTAQQRLAQSALEAIKRYNTIVAVEGTEDLRNGASKYNFEKRQLLLDEEIRGKEIRLLHAVSIKYDSDPNSRSAQKTIRELNEVLSLGSNRKEVLNLNPIHKKSMQVMIDTFHMKAIRKIQAHLADKSTITEILRLIKTTAVRIDEQGADPLTTLTQTLEMAPGSTLTLTALFKKPSPDSKLMSIPILEDLHLSMESTQTGFPYPSQHFSCTLADSIIDANPLRPEQVPTFFAIEQRKKSVAQGLLFDRTLIEKGRKLRKMNKEVVDAEPQVFVDLHRKLNEAILQCSNAPGMHKAVLDRFYEAVIQATSCFEMLIGVQQKIVKLFIVRPARRLQEAWINGDSRLRVGSYQEKNPIAAAILKEEREIVLASLNPQDKAEDAFICLIGEIMGQAAQSIQIQYMSEKIGCAPSMLNEFEQRMQVCAFQQLLNFFNELSGNIEAKDARRYVEDKLHADIRVFQVASLEELNSESTRLVKELKEYFNARFYAKSC